MKINFVSLFLLSCLFFVSCGSSDVVNESKPAASSGITISNRPEWTKIPEKIEKSDVVLFIGDSSETKSEDDAATLALHSAFSKVSNFFGVSVNSEINSREVEKDGEYSYAIGVKSSITGRQIEVKKYNIKEKYIERDGKKYNAFVLLSIPKTELARIQIEVDGFGVWALKSNVSETDKIRELFPVFNGKGIKINQQIDFSDKTPDEIFKETGKAFFLKIECEETKSEEYNEEFYSIVQMKVELFNLMTGETLNRWSVESKGGAHSKGEAVSNAVKNAVKEIIDQI